jgi:hypothetical protein
MLAVTANIREHSRQCVIPALSRDPPFLHRQRRKEGPGSSPGDGSAMKQINVFPMVIMLIAIILLVIWLRPH